MDDLLQALLTLERELAAGTGATYRARLLDEAIVVVPGARLTAAETIAAMDASDGWDRFAMDDARVAAIGPDTAVLSYTFVGERGTVRYAATMSSVYVRRDGEWKLGLHQQTPSS
jgi:hypothetical protein